MKLIDLKTINKCDFLTVLSAYCSFDQNEEIVVDKLVETTYYKIVIVDNECEEVRVLRQCEMCTTGHEFSQQILEQKIDDELTQIFVHVTV